MKKLFLFSILLFLFSLRLTAQKYSIYVLAGPGTVYYWADDVDKDKGSSPVGYSIGLELARNTSARWQFKLGVRYCLWKIPDLIGPFQWPSEQDGNGGYQYDPSLTHYRVSDLTQQKAFQYLSGFRWQSKAEKLHCVADVELGFSSFTKNKAGISTHLKPTFGLAFGAEVWARPNLFFFAKPGVRAIVKGFKLEKTPVNYLLDVHMEMGARYSF